MHSLVDIRVNFRVTIKTNIYSQNNRIYNVAWGKIFSSVLSIDDIKSPLFFWNSGMSVPNIFLM